jgi:5,10-methylenetetrahydromethanopterin reductase
VALEISCAFATSLSTPQHVKYAETLGYHRAWLYDSAALYPDIWVALADCARLTSRIGLATGVLIPTLRHPMVNAAAIAQLSALVPGRLVVGIGSGFTGRVTLGQRPLKWDYVTDYTRCLLALLAGESYEWEGARIKMMHPAGFAPARPIAVPLVFGTAGPKGNAAAKEMAEGIITTVVAIPPAGSFAWTALLTLGTVLDDGEAPTSQRVIEAAGHGVAVALHGMYERKRDLSRIPGAAQWLAGIEALPKAERHIALHDLHLIGVNARDRQLMTPELLRQFGGVRTTDEWRTWLTETERKGVTEICYQPAGPDIEGELSRFAEVAGLSR